MAHVHGNAKGKIGMAKKKGIRFSGHFLQKRERGGSVVECRTPEREVGGSKPTAAMLCP